MNCFTGIIRNLLILNRVFLLTSDEKTFSYKTAYNGFYCKQQLPQIC